jgi:hypothetical protein
MSATPALAEFSGAVHTQQQVRASHLTIAREMIAALDTLTTPGRRHMMGKLAAMLGDEIARVGARSDGVLTRLVERLAEEGDRPWPDTDSFAAQAENLLDLLAAIG